GWASLKHGAIFLLQRGCLYLSNSNDLLQFAVSQGIIDLSLLETQIEMTKREQYLKQHPYEIWQGKNGSWYTYLPDKEKGRVLKRKSTRKTIEDEVIAYWKAEEENPTVKEVFEEWNSYRLSLKKISPATHLRNEQIFKRHFEKLGKERIKNISSADIEDFLEEQIPKYDLTAKAFANLKTITKGFLKRAKKRKLIDFNVEELFQELDVSDSNFAKSHKEDYEEVFDDYEMGVMIDYLERHLDIVNLAILLMFITGLRVGEVVVLRHSDFEENTFRVRRTATRYKNDYGRYVYDIKENPKTQAGVRTVVIAMNYAWITKTIEETNPDEDYIFVKNGKLMNTQMVRERLTQLCDKLGVYHKSPHKIRKTYGSILLDNHVDNRFIIQQMGHTDISCTETHYHRNRKTIEQKTRILSDIPEFQRR
ncbi:MAG: tyrosine-type recombinase/integrase, partial [Lachnospiraceae bacterium]|nr:tyrosine-type recombinase/integrase [Lachnospiraceae bacterium]